MNEVEYQNVEVLTIPAIGKIEQFQHRFARDADWIPGAYIFTCADCAESIDIEDYHQVQIIMLVHSLSHVWLEVSELKRRMLNGNVRHDYTSTGGGAAARGGLARLDHESDAGAGLADPEGR